MSCKQERGMFYFVSLTTESKNISIKKDHLFLKNGNDEKTFSLTRTVEFPRNSTATLRHKTDVDNVHS